MVCKAFSCFPRSDVQIVGCGNGHLLFRLAEEGYPTQTLTGIDYSEDSIQLCTSIAKSKDVEGIKWQVVDFLSSKSGLSGPYELILDKGVSPNWTLTIRKPILDRHTMQYVFRPEKVQQAKHQLHVM